MEAAVFEGWRLLRADWASDAAGPTSDVSPKAPLPAASPAEIKPLRSNDCELAATMKNMSCCIRILMRTLVTIV